MGRFSILALLSWVTFFSACVMTEKELIPNSFNSAAQTSRKTWTILVYMNGDNSLSDYTSMDINEMERSLPTEGINVIVLWDRRSCGAQLLKIAKDISSGIKSARLTASINGSYFSPYDTPEINMMDSNSLMEFVVYGKTAFPADHYAVFLWGHSDGWRSLTTPTRGMNEDSDNGGSNLTNAQIAQALANQNLDVVSFDTCLQGSLETLWAFKKSNVTSYVIASPHEIPGYGWDYSRFLNSFSSSYRRLYDLLYSAVSSYAETYKNLSWSVSLVAYDLTQLDTTVLTDFFNWVHQTENQTSEKAIYENIPSLGGGMRNLYEYIQQTGYFKKTAVQTMLSNMVVYGWSNASSGGSYKGIGIRSSSVDYSNTDLAIDTRWDDILIAWGF